MKKYVYLLMYGLMSLPFLSMTHQGLVSKSITVRARYHLYVIYYSQEPYFFLFSLAFTMLAGVAFVYVTITEALRLKKEYEANKIKTFKMPVLRLSKEGLFHTVMFFLIAYPVIFLFLLAIFMQRIAGI